MTKIDTEDLLTVSQAAEERGVSRQAINHLIRQGKLKAVEIAGKNFISRKALSEFEPDKGGRPSKVEGNQK
jgi:excisionase family DNA binding protein